MSQAFRITAIVSLVLGLAACGETGSIASTAITPVPTASRTPLASPVVAGTFTPAPGSVYFGAYVNLSGLKNGSTPANIADVEQAVGRPLVLHMAFPAFTESLSNNKFLDDFLNFRVPVAAWNCQFSNETIASGQYDLQIKIAATQAKNFGAPMFLSYFWSPNVPTTQMQGLSIERTACWNPNQGDLPHQMVSPIGFILAWQHIRTIFKAEGATNVVWLWSVSNDPGAAPPLPYYPGDQWVDWIGINSFNSNGGSFSSTFSSMYTQLAPLHKPIMISQTGALAAQQPAFFSSAVATLKSQFPAVKGFCYYDSVDYVIGENQDWRVAPAALPAFAALANDPYMAGTYVH